MKVVTFSILITFSFVFFSCNDGNIKECQEKNAQEINEWLKPLKGLKPGRSEELTLPKRNCGDKAFNVDSVVELFVQHAGLHLERVDNKVVISNPQDPCGEEIIRNGFRRQFEKYADLEIDEQRKGSYTISECAKSLDLKLILSQECTKLGLDIEFVKPEKEGTESWVITKVKSDNN